MVCNFLVHFSGKGFSKFVQYDRKRGKKVIKDLCHNLLPLSAAYFSRQDRFCELRNFSTSFRLETKVSSMGL